MSEPRPRGASIADDPQLDELLGRLRRGGHRVTTARRVVLSELLAHRAEHPSVEELTTWIHGPNPDIHLSTVYRTLEFLTQIGILTEVRLADGRASYHLASDAHHHAVCDDCGEVIHLPHDLTADMAARLQREYGFALEPAHLILRGRCARCAKLAESA